MTQPQQNSVSIAGHAFDPLLVQNHQIANNELDPSAASRTWIVQFTEAADLQSTEFYRSNFGLRMTEYVPPRCYIERLSAATAERLRQDRGVRAVTLMTDDLKLSTAIRDDLEANEPTDARVVDVIAFDALADSVLSEVENLVQADDFVAVLDDRSRGGAYLIRVRVDSRTAAAIAGVDGVRFVHEVPDTVDDGGPLNAGTLPGSPAFKRLELTGAGQVIGIIDNGPPDIGHCFFIDRSHQEPGPAHRKIVQMRNASASPRGEHATFSCGILAGDAVDDPGRHQHRGIACQARLACGNRADLKTSSTMLAELSAAAQAGAFVHSNSWHSAPQGFRRPATYDQRAADVDNFTWAGEDHLVVGSSGNTNEEQGPPGTAKNALCVSATAPAGDEGDSVGDGNPGPTADGRRKPDVTGPGCGIESALMQAGELQAEPGAGSAPCRTGRRPAPCASSRATPWVAGVMTLVRQQLMEGRHHDGELRADEGFVPTGSMLRAIAVNSAVAGGVDPAIPSVHRGWGAVDPAAALGQRAPRLLLDVRNAEGLTAGEVCRVAFAVQGGALLAVTLTWAEPPGAIGADSCVVNNLDLRVTSPSGIVMLGNNFAAGESVPDGHPDTVNSTEVVLLGAAAAGTWQVEVVATEVNVGRPGQGFALVVTGAVDPDAEMVVDGDRRLRRTRPIQMSG